jgi:excisionase family DNA binding protein
MGKLLTISEAARELRLSERTVRKRIASGDLPAWRLGPESHAPIRIHEHALELFMRPAHEAVENVAVV